MGETISRRRGRLYYDRGETLLRSRGDFRMGETISRDTGMHPQDHKPGHRIIAEIILCKLFPLFKYLNAGFQEDEIIELLFVIIDWLWINYL